MFGLLFKIAIIVLLLIIDLIFLNYINKKEGS